MSYRGRSARSERLPTIRLGCVVVGALAVANCSGAPQTAGGVDSKYGVAASPRVVESGQPIPKGGGREMIGQTYVIAGQTYTPRDDPNYLAVGAASWYGDAFHGRLTANGEIFDKDAIGAAHPTLPLPSYVRVTNLANSHSMIVRVNDRGPYHGKRVIDVSQRVADALDFKRFGIARVKVEYMGRASLRGSDDRKLVATLRTDGAEAAMPRGSLAPVMVASAAAGTRAAAAAEERSPRVQVASLAPLRRDADPYPSSTKVIRNTPLPPERPFDLGTVPGAGVPTRSFAPPLRPRSAAIGGRTVAASLFYASPESRAVRFSADSPLDRLTPQRFVPLKGSL